MVYRVRDNVDSPEIASAFYFQHLHRGAMDAVNGKILFAPGDSIRIFNL
jgi:hypothetical protein